MFINIWDFLFTRKTWTIIEKIPVSDPKNGGNKAYIFVLKDQFGNIKKKQISDSW